MKTFPFPSFITKNIVSTIEKIVMGQLPSNSRLIAKSLSDHDETMEDNPSYQLRLYSWCFQFLSAMLVVLKQKEYTHEEMRRLEKEVKYISIIFGDFQPSYYRHQPNRNEAIIMSFRLRDLVYELGKFEPSFLDYGEYTSHLDDFDEKVPEFLSFLSKQGREAWLTEAREKFSPEKPWWNPKQLKH